MSTDIGEDDSTGLAFTGERVIPGKVDTDLWNEHISRYYLARSYASAKIVLDVGCGAGYGTQLLGGVADKAFGFDISTDAVRYAVKNHGSCAQYFVGAADAFPFADGSVGLLTCFEVIEHVARPEAVLNECARVLAPNDGLLLISTPNKPHYTKARGDVGPNPFHQHEFDLAELRDALDRRFSFFEIFAQNQQEAVVFVKEQCGHSGTAAFVKASLDFADAPFFLAICSHAEVDLACFTYLAESGDRLTARERHIEILQAELADLQVQMVAARTKLDDVHLELAGRTEWAKSLDGRVNGLEHRNTALENELTREKLHVQQIQNSLWFRIGRRWQRILGRGQF